MERNEIRALFRRFLTEKQCNEYEPAINEFSHHYAGEDEETIIEKMKREFEFFGIEYKGRTKTALITEEIGKGWIISDDSLSYIDATGRGYETAREAINAARMNGYTHYRGANRKDRESIYKL